MNKEKTCYLFFDLDGTVYFKGAIPKENLLAMKAAQDKGHKLILNTGRSRGNTIPTAAAFDVPWDGMIFSGGAEMRWKSELLYRQTVSPSDCHAWLSYCLKKQFSMSFGCSEALLSFDFKKNTELCTEENAAVCRARLDELLEKDGVTNLTVRGTLPSDYPKTEMTVIQLPTYADIFPPKCNKGNAILRFCEMMDVALDQCACFGDSQNDLDMFRVCPTGVCMSHAPQELIDLSLYHAKSEFGVAEGLQYLFDVPFDR